MGNSPLVNHIRISPNKNSPRNHEIDTISIHCVVGQVTAESLGEHFAKSSTAASSNYCVDKDGRIGMYVEEKDRSWCTSNRDNDHRAITIEVASDTKHPYTVTDKAYFALIDLLVDICKRNPKIGYLRWKADKSLIGQVDKQNMTVHRWFANKSCPGDYLYNLHYDIAEKVNAKLGINVIKDKNEIHGNNIMKYIKGTATKLSKNFKSIEFDCHGNGCCTETIIDMGLIDYLQVIRDHFGRAITITSGYRCPVHNGKVSRAKNSYHTKGMAADFVVSGVAPREVAKYAESIGIKGIGLYETKNDGYFVHIDTRTDKSFWYGHAETPIETFNKEQTNKPTTEAPFLVKIAIDNLNMRIGPSVFYDAIKYIPRGVYTIIEVNGDWGRLKSKQAYNGKSVDGWIHLGYAIKL